MDLPRVFVYSAQALHAHLTDQLARNPFLAPQHAVALRIADGAEVRVAVDGAEMSGTVVAYHADGSYLVRLANGATPTVDAAALERINPGAPRVPA